MKEIDNIEKLCVNMAEQIGKIMDGIDIVAPLKTLAAFAELLKDIPDEIKDTQLFAKVQALSKMEIKYEDAVWVVEEFGQTSVLDDWKSIPEYGKNKSDLQKYIVQIIFSQSIDNREKLPVLLAHMEPLIYESLDITKKEKDRVKDVAYRTSMRDNSGMSIESIGKVFVMAIVFIVFANTDSYTDEIDKRLPFRNNILHNGVVAYNKEDVDIAYELLVNYIEILMTIEYRVKTIIKNK